MSTPNSARISSALRCPVPGMASAAWDGFLERAYALPYLLVQLLNLLGQELQVAQLALEQYSLMRSHEAPQGLLQLSPFVSRGPPRQVGPLLRVSFLWGQADKGRQILKIVQENRKARHSLALCKLPKPPM